MPADLYSLWEKIKNGAAEIARTRLFIVIIVFCVLFSILTGRLFSLQIIHGEEYLNNLLVSYKQTEEQVEEEMDREALLEDDE